MFAVRIVLPLLWLDHIVTAMSCEALVISSLSLRCGGGSAEGVQCHRPGSQRVPPLLLALHTLGALLVMVFLHSGLRQHVRLATVSSAPLGGVDRDVMRAVPVFWI